MLHGQAEALLPMIEAAMREAGLAPAALDLVAVTTGPGSFTGIRLGLAAARGIALAADRPLIGVTSLAAVAAAVEPVTPRGHALLVALESRRAELYFQLFDRQGRTLDPPAAALPEALAEAVDTLAPGPLAVAGDAAARAAAALAGRSGVVVVEASVPVVVGLARAALRQWREGMRGGGIEPVYLRPPDVTAPNGRSAPSGR
jgi:tRNA threonylcarbamoyladenosine biosynthesis protein TsaB